MTLPASLPMVALGRALAAASAGLLLTASGSLAAAPPAGRALADAPAATDPRVRLTTGLGAIDVRLYLAAAPVTVCNFLRYALGGEYDGGQFFRTVRGDQGFGNPVPIDVVQVAARAGEEADRFGPIALERTNRTGLTHRAGALSMARWGPDTATSSFSIVVRASPEMDYGGRRNSDGQGFAVFGQVVRGMAVVRAIQAQPAQDERLLRPVGLSSVRLSAGPQALARIRTRCALPATATRPAG